MDLENHVLSIENEAPNSSWDHGDLDVLACYVYTLALISRPPLVSQDRLIGQMQGKPVGLSRHEVQTSIRI